MRVYKQTIYGIISLSNIAHKATRKLHKMINCFRSEQKEGEVNKAENMLLVNTSKPSKTRKMHARWTITATTNLQ